MLAFHLLWLFFLHWSLAWIGMKVWFEGQIKVCLPLGLRTNCALLCDWVWPWVNSHEGMTWWPQVKVCLSIWWVPGVVHNCQICESASVASVWESMCFLLPTSFWNSRSWTNSWNSRSYAQLCYSAVLGPGVGQWGFWTEQNKLLFGAHPFTILLHCRLCVSLWVMSSAAVFEWWLHYLFAGWGAHSANDPGQGQFLNAPISLVAFILSLTSQTCDDFCLSLLFTVHISLSCALAVTVWLSDGLRLDACCMRCRVEDVGPWALWFSLKLTCIAPPCGCSCLMAIGMFSQAGISLSTIVGSSKTNSISEWTKRNKFVFVHILSQVCCIAGCVWVLGHVFCCLLWVMTSLLVCRLGCAHSRWSWTQSVPQCSYFRGWFLIAKLTVAICAPQPHISVMSTWALVIIEGSIHARTFQLAWPQSSS